MGFSCSQAILPDKLKYFTSQLNTTLLSEQISPLIIPLQSSSGLELTRP
jgi:hypothetical protein